VIQQRTCKRTCWIVRLVPLSEMAGSLIISPPLGCHRHTEAHAHGVRWTIFYRHQAGVLPGPGMARINRATCSGSSSWTKC
jgi:hypothetical protein